MIRVLLVDDSPLALATLQKMLANAPEIQVVGTAANGVQAMEKIPQLHPDVVCTDLHMPRMDGFHLTQEIMAHHPLPILVVSISVQREDDYNIFQLLEAGAIDVYPKPRGGLDGVIGSAAIREFVGKIKLLSGVVPIRRHRRHPPLEFNQERTLPPPIITDTSRPIHKEVSFHGALPSRLVLPAGGCLAIGASTGGPQAIQAILTPLPRQFPLPILIVQHISTGFLMEMIHWLENHTHLKVQVAKTGEKPQAGTIYFPPEERHMIINQQGCFEMMEGTPLDYFLDASPWHCPSIDVAFASIARYYGKKSVGVLLTGMGRDGAEGLRTIAQAGGMTIAQDEATCVVFGMPKEAIALGAVRMVLPIHEIATALTQAVSFIPSSDLLESSPWRTKNSPY